MSHAVLDLVFTLADRHDGVVTTAELSGAGLTRNQIDHLVVTGVLERSARGVYRLVAAHKTWAQRLRIATLVAGAGAVVSHRAAARLHELDGFDRAPVEVSVPRRRGRSARGLVHVTSDLASRDVHHRNGLQVTNATRTIVDLAATVDPSALEIAVDDALRRGLTTPGRLRSTVERLARPGRAGITSVRTLLDERSEWLGTTDSALETMLLRVLLGSGLPHPVPQFELVHGEERIGRFDFAYPDAAVLIEADSEQWHMRRDRFVNDRTRRDRATALGWRVFEFTHHHITGQPGFVAATVRAALSPAA